jgi:hypothetical protein
MRKFKFDSRYVDPEQAALADSQMFEVEQVLDHVFEGRELKTNLRFKVQWVGLANPTWENYDTMSKVQLVHEYLRQKKLQKFLPVAFQPQRTPRLKRSLEVQPEQHPPPTRQSTRTKRPRRR